MRAHSLFVLVLASFTLLTTLTLNGAAGAERFVEAHVEDVEYQGATISAGTPRKSARETIKITVEHDNGSNPGPDREQADYVIDVDIDASDSSESKAEKILAALLREIDTDNDPQTNNGGLGDKAEVTKINSGTVFIDPDITNRGRGVRSITMTNRSKEKHKLAKVPLIHQAESFSPAVAASRVEEFRSSLREDSVWNLLTDAEISANSVIGIVQIDTGPSGVSVSYEPAFISVETESGEVTVLTSNAQSLEELTVELRRKLAQQGDAVRVVAQGLIVVFFGAGEATWLGNDVTDDALSVTIGVYSQF